MKLPKRLSFRLLTLSVLLTALRGCYGEGTASNALPTGEQPVGGAARRDAATKEDDGGGFGPVLDGGGPSVVPTSDGGPVGACVVARTTEPVPARSVVISAQIAERHTLFVRDLFDKFKAVCGGCHVEDHRGDFQVSPITFSKDMTDEVLARIFTDDTDKIMPEDVGPASSRDPKKDPALALGTLLRAWYAQGKPPDIYLPPETTSADAGAGAGNAGFKMAEGVGKALTNLGNCIPSTELVGLREVDMVDHDAFFEQATTLPPRLEQTDITTFDSEVLAQSGVVAYAPTYPLWSDDARKIRHVRVPAGKAIQFDGNTQQFDIPDNTRFYKTFLKRYVETDGSVRYRKVETRLIVARHPVKDANGSAQQTALFGTYAWDDNETEATLVNEPLRDGKPFRDVLITLVTDQRKYDEVLKAHHQTDAGDAASSLTRELQKAGATRRYAIPGSERCVQCHMGSPSQSFVLGFTPLQVYRRPLGVGGIIEGPGPDDLTQLSRLIDYGIIKGLSRPDEIRPLESSQGDRHPRNDAELVAQGYMIGNCSHCHNPLGYPSAQNPVLANTLSFLPGPGPSQGIFQFPLEQFSQRIKRDIGGSVRIPYITPSLFDFPGQGDFNHQANHADTGTTTAVAGSDLVLAPWRSLIYRNVDTPFAYANDLALFPHMPMNVPGFDCRAPRIMAEWMLSIPSLRKNGKIEETLVQGVGLEPGHALHDNKGTDTEEQPYREILPHQEGYPAALADVEARLAAYHGTGKKYSGQSQTWIRYGYCPDTSDIVDPTVTGADRAHLVPSDLRVYSVPASPCNYSTDCADTDICQRTKGPGTLQPDEKLGSCRHPCKTDDDCNDPARPGQACTAVTFTDSGGVVHVAEHVCSQNMNVPVDYQPYPGVGLYSEDLKHIPLAANVIWPDDGVPDRPHWVVTDTTENPGAWSPRRSEWKDILVDHKGEVDDQMWKVVEMLNPKDTSKPGVTLEGVKAFAENEIPYGLWQKKDNCQAQLQRVKKVSEFSSARPKWMDVVKPPDDAPVYSEFPGAAIFNMVCVNCHGPLMDSHGRQADTLQLMTGGDARVANFRDGLFGPFAMPGANRQREFAVDGSGSVTTDDWAARYLVWMALGGTQKLIPKAILDVVATTPIFGTSRNLPGVDSANMLGPVQTLCGEFFQMSGWAISPDESPPQQFKKPEDTSKWDNWVWKMVLKQEAGTLMDQNGDAELLARLCSLNNPMPVRTIQIDNAQVPVWQIHYYPADAYPADAPVGTDRDGQTTKGIAPDNLMPWCIEPRSDMAVVRPYLTDPPICPDKLLAAEPQTQNQIRQWSYRGAINAGLAVFLYVDKVEHGYKPVPPYNQCESLQ